MSESNGNNLLSLQGLEVHYATGGGMLSPAKVVRAVDGVSLDIKRGETLGLVGESGCGKSTLGKAILRLTEPTGGKVIYGGKDLANLSRAAMRDQRRHLQMIFQDPYASLNPRMTVGSIIAEPIKTFGLAKGKGRRPAGSGPDGNRRIEPPFHQTLSARILRRPASAYRHRPCPGGRPGIHRRGRADLGSRRFDPGPDHEPDGKAAGAKKA